MNELQYHGSTQGDSVYRFPHGGFFWFFRQTSPDTVVLEDVEPAVETVSVGKYSTDLSLEELPNPVRRAIITSEFRLRSRENTLEGAMGGVSAE